jgi:hypothetical protein
MTEQEIGVVTHYFGHVGVAVIKVTADGFAVGDTIHVKGHTADFTCAIDSMQVDHKPVQAAKIGDAVGVKVPAHAHEHDRVFRVVA